MASQVDTKEGRDWTTALLKTQEVTISFTKKTEQSEKCSALLLKTKFLAKKCQKTAENQNPMMHLLFLMLKKMTGAVFAGIP